MNSIAAVPIVNGRTMWREVRGFANAETVRGFAAALSAAPLTYHLTNPDRVVFCFPNLIAAVSFAGRFGGELLPAR